MSYHRDPRIPHRPSPLSVGLQWASTITTIGLMMALPPLFGQWLDNRYGTGPVWTVVLAVLGFLAAMRQLWGIAQRLSAGNRPPGTNGTRPGRGET